MKWAGKYWNNLSSFVIAHAWCFWLMFGLTGIFLILTTEDLGSWIQIGWDWLSEGESNSEAIRNVGLVIAGAIALPVALWRSLVAQRQAAVAQRQALTAQFGLAEDRYQKGAEMLGSDVLAVRVGGVYVLRTLMDDVQGVYGAQINRLLCAFVRNPTEDPSLLFNDESPHKPLLRDDVKAALECVTVRDARVVEHERSVKYMHDIVDARLQRLAMPQPNFANFNLSRVNLTSSLIVNADFSDAILAFANLSDADLRGANFNRATLCLCDLSGTKLSHDPSQPDDSARHFVARNLTQCQLDQAVDDPDNPPILDGVIDPETGKQLVWRGGAPSS